jgi:hypothetical protein
MLRDNRDKLCCMNNETKKKKKRMSSLFRNRKTIRPIGIEEISFLENHDFLLE